LSFVFILIVYLPFSSVSAVCFDFFAITSTPFNGNLLNVVTVPVNDLPNVKIDDFPWDKVSRDHHAVELPKGTPAGGWYLADGVQGNFFYPSTGIGVYEIIYYYTDMRTGCSNSAATKLDVVDEVMLEQQTTHEIIEIEPSRIESIFTVVNNTENKCKIDIIDSNGKKVLQLSDPVEIDLSNFKTGTYFLEINVEGLYFKKKMITL